MQKYPTVQQQKCEPFPFSKAIYVLVLWFVPSSALLPVDYMYVFQIIFSRVLGIKIRRARVLDTTTFLPLKFS